MQVVLCPFRFRTSGITSYSQAVAKALDTAGIDLLVVGFDMGSLRLADQGFRSVSLGEDPMLMTYAGGPLVTYAYIRSRMRRFLRTLTKRVDAIHYIFPGSTVRQNNSEALIAATSWEFQSPSDIIRNVSRNFRGVMKVPAVLDRLEHYYHDLRGYARSDVVVGTTSESIAFWSKRIPEFKGMYIPPPVDVPSYLNRDETGDSVRFLVGERDLDRKRNNVWLVLDVLAQIHNAGITNFEVELVGVSSEGLRRRVGELSRNGMRIRLTHYLPHAAFQDALERTDVALVPRFIHDQGAYWPLEAMARGTTVISSNLPAFRDFVIDGYTGLTFNLDEPEELRWKLMMVLTDDGLLRQLKRGARDFILEKHSLPIVGRQLERVYRSR